MNNLAQKISSYCLLCTKPLTYIDNRWFANGFEHLECESKDILCDYCFEQERSKIWEAADYIDVIQINQFTSLKGKTWEEGLEAKASTVLSVKDASPTHERPSFGHVWWKLNTETNRLEMFKHNADSSG